MDPTAAAPPAGAAQAAAAAAVGLLEAALGAGMSAPKPLQGQTARCPEPHMPGRSQMILLWWELIHVFVAIGTQAAVLSPPLHHMRALNQ